jgi:hypothetical protein
MTATEKRRPKFDQTSTIVRELRPRRVDSVSLQRIGQSIDLNAQSVDVGDYCSFDNLAK